MLGIILQHTRAKNVSEDVYIALVFRNIVIMFGPGKSPVADFKLRQSFDLIKSETIKRQTTDKYVLVKEMIKHFFSGSVTWDFIEQFSICTSVGRVVDCLPIRLFSQSETVVKPNPLNQSQSNCLIIFDTRLKTALKKNKIKLYYCSSVTDHRTSASS